MIDKIAKAFFLMFLAVASLMTAATLSVGIAFAKPPTGLPFQDQVLQVTQMEGPEKHVTMGITDLSLAQCAPGEVLTGGGYVVDSRPEELVIVRTSAVTVPATGWGVLATTTGLSSFHAVAECASLAKAP